MEKLKKYNFVKVLPKYFNLIQKLLNFSSFVFIFIIFIHLLNISNEADEVSDYLDLKNQNVSYSCSISEYEFKKFANENFSNYELKIFIKNISVYPEIRNIKCLKQIDSFFINEDIKTIDVVINDNPKFFNILDQLINGFLCLFIFFSRRLNLNNFLNYIIFNLFLDIFFAVNLSLIKIIIPFTEPETLNQRYFFRVLFLILLVIKLKNLKIISLFTLILLFFIPDYLGLFALIFLLSDIKKLVTYSRFDIYLFSSIPIIFYFSKFLFSINSFFDKFWILSSQRIYHGYKRFYDLQWNFLTFRCNAEPDFKPKFYFAECRNLYGGILDNFIALRTDPYFSAFVFQFFCLLFLSYIYLKEIKKQDHKHMFFLVFIFVSPPMIFLISQGNPDLFIFLISYFVLNMQKPKYLLVLITFFLLFLFKLHPIGGIFGIFYYFIKNNEKINITLSFTFIVLSTVFLIVQLGDFSGYGYLDLVLTKEEAYGIYHYSYLIGGPKNLFIYSLLTIFLIVLTNLNIVKTSAIKMLEIEKNSYFYSLLFWFLLTSIYSNNSYRLPIFIILFLSLYKVPYKKLHKILLPFIFLIPTPVVAYTYIQIIYHIIFGSSFFLITAVFFKFVLNEIQELIQKRYQQANFKLKHK